MSETKVKIMQLFKSILCRHDWDINLIFSGGRNSHREIKSCQKCGKSITLFCGTRQEWYDYNGFGEAKN